MAQARSVMMPERTPAEKRLEARGWPVPQRLMFVVTTSACLWAVLVGGVYWLIWERRAILPFRSPPPCR